jgi:hypothetical protein
MKDYKNCQTTSDYMYEQMMRRLTRIILITALILEAMICIISAYSLPKPSQDLMISPEMQSYIETYHVEVDEYGVE